MATRSQVELAAKFYEAQKSMKFLFGEKYPEKVTEYRNVVEAVQKAQGSDTLNAAKTCIEKIIEHNPFDNGIHVAMILATAVEMIEK